MIYNVTNKIEQIKEKFFGILNEKATREEYRERSLKKKYNFKPDKPGLRTGTIDVDGDKHRIDFEHSKKVNIDFGDDTVGKQSLNRSTGTSLADKNGTIILNRDFFKLKGSNNSERRDAALAHEIGHKKLHNIIGDTVEPSKKSEKVFKDITNYNNKNIQEKWDLNKKLENYMKNASKTSNERDKIYNIAKKYEKTGHTTAKEFEADRYAANRTSERAIRKAIMQLSHNKNKIVKNDIDKDFGKASSQCKNIKKELKEKYPELFIKKQPIKKIYLRINKSLNNNNDDIVQRSKALKDKEMKKSIVYK